MWNTRALKARARSFETSQDSFKEKGLLQYCFAKHGLWTEIANPSKEATLLMMSITCTDPIIRNGVLTTSKARAIKSHFSIKGAVSLRVAQETVFSKSIEKCRSRKSMLLRGPHIKSWNETYTSARRRWEREKLRCFVSFTKDCSRKRMPFPFIELSLHADFWFLAEFCKPLFANVVALSAAPAYERKQTFASAEGVSGENLSDFDRKSCIKTTQFSASHSPRYLEVC